MSPVRSTLAGAVLGALLILAAALAAVKSSGHIPAFSANRGLLQSVVAVPLALAATAGILAYSRLLTTAQMLWATLPVAVLVLVGAGTFGLGYRALGWVLALNVVILVPWVAGLSIGSALRGSAGAAPGTVGTRRHDRIDADREPRRRPRRDQRGDG